MIHKGVKKSLALRLKKKKIDKERIRLHREGGHPGLTLGQSGTDQA